MTSDDLTIFDENLGVMVTHPENEFAWRHVNLADPRFRTAVVRATDGFFTQAERILAPSPTDGAAHSAGVVAAEIVDDDHRYPFAPALACGFDQ